MQLCLPPISKPSLPDWGNWASMLATLHCLTWGAQEGSGCMAGSPGFLQAFHKQEHLDAAVPNSPAYRYPQPMPTTGIPCAELPAPCHSAVTRLCCLYSQGFLPTLETAFQCLVGELISSGPCTRCFLPISTFNSHSVPAGAGPCGQGTPVPMAATPPVCGVNWEPPGRQRALQKHSFLDCNKLVDFALLVEIMEMKKLLMRMTDGRPNDQTA